MSKVEVNQVTQQCGTTLTVGGGACKTAVVDATTVTLGRCGGTVSLASGATQSGFGRTGTVDWDTSIKTSTVTAATGKGYFVNTTSGGITVNLPAAAVGSIVAVSDYASTSASNNITIAPNGLEKINGVNDTYVIQTAGLAVTLVYADAARGWKSVTGSDADATGVVPAYVVATSPCTATVGDYKIHTFTGPGALCVSCAGNPAGSDSVDYLVVAGGGGGATYYSGVPGVGGAGGGGGFRESKAPGAPWTASPIVSATSIPVSATPYTITVGGGGPGAPPSSAAVKGSDSIFATITSTGGGEGGNGGSTPAASGGPGGSGGGAGGTGNSGIGGTGNTPTVTPDQGKDGGDALTAAPGYGGGGGGGATEAGVDGTPTVGGRGGAGGTTCISNAPVGYAGGGGAGAYGCGAAGAASPCGSGAAGGIGPGVPCAAAVNRGGGGGGHGKVIAVAGGNGGSGIVIIRYKFQ